MKKVKKILVTGASGFLGSHICDVLHEAGYEVHAIVRASSSKKWLEQAWLKLHTLELTDRGGLRKLLKGFDAVVHSAAELIGASVEALHKVNVEATLILAEEAARMHVRRFVFISSRDASGFSRNKIPKRESDPDNPHTPYGKSKKHAEEALAALKDEISIVNLRPCLIYGPRDRHLFRLFKLIKTMPAVPIVGSKPVYMSLVFVRDVALAVLASLRASVPSGSKYYISDGMPHTLEDFYRTIASSLGKKTRLLRVPARPAAMFVGLMYGARTREMALTPETIMDFRYRYRLVSTERAIRELNWKPETMLDEGVALTADWYRSERWL
jgi:nucleoside-diphosphate-sugar epimerase